MELIQYLREYFFTKQELLEYSNVTEQELIKYQANRVMPKCSYKLNMNVQSDSFFGLYNDEQVIEYYAKGYVSWLAIIQTLNSNEAVYSLFSLRYKNAIENLKEQGHSTNSAKLTSELNQHIKDEWEHFLNGIYGLCTQSGLPEDIAAKEFSILEINELLALNELTAEQINKLTTAVNLLDAASSLFAPHERMQSSRQRLVNDVRRKYQLI